MSCRDILCSSWIDLFRLLQITGATFLHLLCANDVGIAINGNIP